MKQDIRLYLAGMRADLKEDPKILFNYKVTDTQSPVSVKNSFTKTITLDGTDNNNAIFGAIYDLSRLQTYGAGSYSGTDFNPLKKADFALYVDSELYETGYFKLTEVVKTLGNVQYSIVCYGGLGEFIYNLSTTESGNKLEFKDLKITPDRYDPWEVEDLGFTISKETVEDAWDNIYSNSSKYSTVNFVPCYNGIPSDIEPSKVLINLRDKPSYLNNVTGITSFGGWAKGSCSRNITEWEARDLRSYLQRPALRVRTLINTCCNPANNGGYEVKLDQKFFAENNPYYGDAWITLGPISDILGTDNESSSEEVTGATVTHDNANLWNINANADFSSFNNLTMDLVINMEPEEPTTASTLYLSTRKSVKNTITLQNRFVKGAYEYYSAILLQLVAYDELGKVVATSNAYQLTNEIPGLDRQPDFKDQMSASDISIPEWKTLYGCFIESGGTYTWADSAGNPQRINFKFPANTNFYSLKLRVQRPSYEYYKLTGLGNNWRRYSSSTGSRYMFEKVTETINGNYEPNWYKNHEAVWSNAEFLVENFYVTATRYGGFLSGKYIPQDKLLTLGITPAEFLLSYTKLFGLHIWKDPVDKIIHIADRSVFYKRDEIVDIDKLIDRSKPMKITPQVAQTKWYDFSTPQHESDANDHYLEDYGMDFGLQRVNTNYDFDTDIKSVYDGKFYGGVQVLENSYYYYEDFFNWPVYCYNGFTLTTYVQSGTSLAGTDHTVNVYTEVNQNPINTDNPGFDLFDKPQFHGKDNESGDGSLVLLFFRGFKEAPQSGAKYFITDDIDEMVTINEKKPCWIMTEGEYDSSNRKVGILVDEFPRFSRYCVYESTGHITHSFDFGRTQETYIPDTIITPGSSVYERCWKNYIADMYDVNSRKLTCYCLIRGQVSLEHLRKIYHFDNSLWVLNALKEWNPGSYDTTLCEFLKVNDLQNYDLETITEAPAMDFFLIDYSPVIVEGRYKTYNVPAEVSAVTFGVDIQDGGPWSFADGVGGYYTVEYDNGVEESYPYSALTASGDDGGVGNTRDVFNIGANNPGTGRTFHLSTSIYSPEEIWCHLDIIQPSGTGPTPPEPETGLTVTIQGSGYTAAGGTLYGSVEASDNWTGSTDSAWLTLTPTAGTSGTTSIEVTAAANGTDSARTGEVYVALEGGGPARFALSQEAGSGPTPPPGPTQTTVLYNVAGQFETNIVDLGITVYSYGGFSDTSSLIGMTGNQQSETGNIDVELENSAQTLGFSIVMTGMIPDPQISGHFEMRCAYNGVDTGYIPVTVGAPVQFSSTYATGAYGTLYIDIIWSNA